MFDQHQLQIMIVDDDTRLTERLAMGLKKDELFVKIVRSAPKALDIIKQTPVDILITDIHMPEMNGLEFSQLVLNMNPDTQIIMMSVHMNINTVIEAMKLGAVDFLQKPFETNVLRDAILQSIEKWKERNKLRMAYNNLEKEKELLAVTMRSIGDGVIATDIDGRIIMMNRVAEQLTGWSIDSAKNKLLTDVFYIINEKTRKICENPVEKVLNSGHVIGLANHTALITKDGTEKSIADSAAPIKNRDSKIIGIVLVFRDASLERMVNEELAKTKKLESIGMLAAGIAHDFNNILTSIMGNINLAKSILDTSHEIYEFLEAAEASSKRASKLTKKLLTFSKGGEPIRQCCNIYEIVRESSDFVLSGSSITCRIDRDPDLWQAHVDKDQICQVIQNLVLNAQQAMPEGGTLHIVCENYLKICKQDAVPVMDGDYVRITISDEGVGIHPEHIEKIFDPYFSTKQKGGGLGLAVSHSIIKKHSGYILCESIPARGTTITIYLPATRISTKSKKILPVPVGQGTILIMDDEKMVREIVCRMLKKIGYSVLQADDGRTALQLYKNAMHTKKPVDLVIMDLTIPGGMGGIEAIKRLHKIDPDARAIVSSGYANDPVMANYQEYGFVGVLDKPFLKDKLLRVVSESLENK
jgi:PAS domain S-box-containing protein